MLGAGFLGWSAVASVLLALFYALWEHLPHLFPDLSAYPLLAAIAGGIFIGVGAGLVVRSNASAGGDDALALSIHKLTGLKLARCYLFSDLSVLLLSLSYIPVTKIAFSLVTVFISSPLIDVIVGFGRDEAPVDARGFRVPRGAFSGRHRAGGRPVAPCFVLATGLQIGSSLDTVWK